MGCSAILWDMRRHVFPPHVHLVYIAVVIWITITVGCAQPSDSDTFSPNNGDNNSTVNNDATSPMHITLIEPEHGPVAGGTVVVIRGFGFENGSQVKFGDRWAPSDLTNVLSPDRIVCVSPPGEVGTVPITVMAPDGRTTTLDIAFSYDRFSLDPDSGPASGGTYVRITSPDLEFQPQDTILFGDATLLDTHIMSSGLVIGRTPPHDPETVDLVVRRDATTLTVEDAFTYYDSSDPAYGGFGGGPISGQLTVTVLNIYSRQPVSGAFVLLGTDPDSTFSARTDSNGTVVFASPDLRGPQMLTVAYEGYQISTFIGFDRSEVTVFLYPVNPPPRDGNGLPTIPNPVYGQVIGNLLFRDQEYQMTCLWDRVVPQPPEGYRRVVRIYQTFGYYSAPSPEILRIYEDTSQCVDGFGIPFSLTVWPSTLTLYAEAGWEHADDGKDFTPFAYGIVRNLVVGPEEEVSATLEIIYSLEGNYSFTLSQPPELSDEGPSSYRIKLFLDLGSEGYLVRSSATVSTTDASETIYFSSQPRPDGPLADASLAVYAEAYSGGEYPFSFVLLDPVVTQTWPGRIGPFLPVPSPLVPQSGEELEDSRIVLDGGYGLTPTFYYIKLNTFPDGDTFWRIYANGALRSFRLPDLDGVQNVPIRPAGSMYMHVLSAYIPSMDFDSFSYRYLSRNYHAAEAGDGVLFSF